MADAPGTQPVIMVRDLRFRYPGTGEDALRIPFLDVPATGMTAVTGPSGPARSALIELLTGTLREPYEGTVCVLGAEWRSLARDADRQRQLRRIGLIPQDYGLLSNRTPAELLGQDLADSGVPKDQRAGRIEAALAAVGLGPFAGRQIAGLSGGQRQRVAIARMLARQVECVIADEPTANLDPALTAETMSLFRYLAGYVPVIIITHDPAVAAACDRTIVLQSAVTGPAGTVAPAPARRVSLLLAAIIAVCLLAIVGIIAVIIIPAPGQGSSGQRAKTGALPPASPTVQAHRSPPPAVSPSASPVASRPPAAAGSPLLPVLTVGDWTGTDPSTLGFSADGGNIVSDIIWSSWTATSARGLGTSYLDNCVPNCAQGTTTTVPATITLSDPVDGRFTVIKERRAGATTIFTYSGFWPLDAS